MGGDGVSHELPLALHNLQLFKLSDAVVQGSLLAVLHKRHDVDCDHVVRTTGKRLRNRSLEYW